jgi:hypothetical protein
MSAQPKLRYTLEEYLESERVSDDGFWLHREFDFLGEVVKLASFDCELPLKEIYRNVKFDASKIK